MSSRPRPASLVLVFGLIGTLIAACSPGGGTGASVTPPTTSASSGAVRSPDESLAPTKLVVGLGFIPSVQFAQFYLAQQKGYYADGGLDVEFQNKIDPDLITLVGAGTLDLGIGDGTSVIPATSQGIPVEYVATIYGKFPNIVFAKESSGIKKPADLKGKKIGTPGKYGSSWVMLQAMLSSAGLTTDDVEIVEYPEFNQEAAVEQGAVDAATGFANNEPIQLEQHGGKPVVLHVDDITPLPGPGLIASTATLDAKHDAISAFVAATLQAMNEIKDDPAAGLDAAIATIPELASSRDTQAAILAATIDSWAGPVQTDHGLGAIDRDGWTSSITFMTGLGMVKEPVKTDDIVREDLLPSGD
ncbi:MAG: ABC transporter substrate-binding protein [Chloroflexota bacterium]